MQNEKIARVGRFREMEPTEQPQTEQQTVSTVETKEPVIPEPKAAPTYCTINNVGFAADRNANHRRVMEVCILYEILFYH